MYIPAHCNMDGPVIILDNQTEILMGCRLGDRHSQERLYRQFYPGLFALCKKFFDDHHDILTSLNNGMLNVYKNIGLYDPEKGSLFSWAYGTVRHAALTYLRNKQRDEGHMILTEEMELYDPVNPFDGLEWKGIYFFLSKLPPSTRAVCTLYYIEGFSISEVAGHMGLSEGTIKWHLSDGRKKLRSILTKTTITKSA